MAPPETVLRERREVRAEMEGGRQTLINSRKREDIFRRILRIQEHLVTLARREEIPVLDADTREGMLAQFADSLTLVLEKVLHRSGVPIVEL